MSAIQKARSLLASAAEIVYPPQCLTCDARVASDGLCPACWSNAGFLTGLTCATCAQPLPGESEQDEHCDACLRDLPPWARAQAVMLYEGTGRKLVLGLKERDRTETAPILAHWMAAKAEATAETKVVPIPLHRLRLLQRRFNQSAILAQYIARERSLTYAPELLARTKRTPPLKTLSRADRATALQGALAARPCTGQSILLVDDVMTTGATLRAATEALMAAGAATVSVVVLARRAEAP